MSFKLQEKRYLIAVLLAADNLSICDITLEATLTEYLISATTRSMGRKKINDEQMPGRFPSGTFARMDAVLAPGEKRSDLLREAVERELKRRERSQATSVQTEAHKSRKAGEPA